MQFLKRYRLFIAALAVSLLVAGCAGIRQGVSWPDLTIIGDEQYILVAYNDFMVLVDPASNGRPVPLRNPDGQVRTDAEGNPRHWEVSGDETGSQFFASPVWLDDETLLVADYNEKLWQVNFTRAALEAGTEIALPGHVFADLAMNDNSIFVPVSDKSLVAFDASTFDSRWIFETERGLWSQPLVVNGTVYFASMDHSLYAVDAQSGSQIWRTDLRGALPASPLFVDSHLYVGSLGRRIFDVSVESGEIVAEYETEDWVWNTPVMHDGILYSADLSGYVYALDPERGFAEVWKVKAAEGGIRGRPLVTDEFVVVGARDGNVHWLERETGAVQFSQDVDAEILSDIILIEASENISEPLVVVSTVNDAKTLVAFTLEGAPRWTYGR